MNENILKGQIEFFEKFGQMLNSGVPLMRSLTILSKEIGNKEVKSEIEDIVKNLESADAFYKCFNNQFFSESTLAMLELGETKGELDYICIKIANCLRAQLAYTQ